MPSSASLAFATLVAHGISKSYGPNPVLSAVDLSVGPKQRVGVVGPNGAGKTTLLRILAGLEQPDAGRVEILPANATVGYLAQEPERHTTETAREMLGRRSGIALAERRLMEAATALAENRSGAEEAYGAALERFISLEAGEFDGRLGEVLAELQLDENLLERPTAELSGGQRAKVSLAALLVSRFDILLLDEPTNDLDFDGIARLESYLSARVGGTAIVSHDRSFLARSVNAVLEVDEWTHETALYSGSFDTYLKARQDARRHAEQAYEAYMTERGRLQGRLREQRQWAVQGVRKEVRKQPDSDKVQRDFRVNRTEKQASKVRITEKALGRLEVVERPYEPWQLRLEIPSLGRSGEIVAEIENGVVERGDFRLGPVDLHISFGEKVAILGPNGSGKSTLLAAVLGRLPLSEGRARLGSSVVVGELGQDRRRFFNDGPLIESFLAATGTTVSESRSLLAKFGLSAGDVQRPAVSLSPGERTRAELALLVARGTNCLVLDEPTNHLDLAAIEQLEATLSGWQATLLLVTHDQALLEAIEVTRQVQLDNGNVVSDNSFS